MEEEARDGDNWVGGGRLRILRASACGAFSLRVVVTWRFVADKRDLAYLNH